MLLKRLVELSFQNRELRGICEEIEKAEVAFGSTIAKKLQNRLSDLRAAKTVHDLPPIGNLALDFDSTYKLELSKEFILKFCCNHINTPYLGDGTIDWGKVKRIKILEIAHV